MECPGCHREIENSDFHELCDDCNSEHYDALYENDLECFAMLDSHVERQISKNLVDI